MIRSPQSNENSIFNEEFVGQLSGGESNPFEGVELTREDKELLDRLSGAKYAREKKELEELREKVAVNELTGLLRWRTEMAQKQVEKDLNEAGRHRDEVWFGIFDIDTLKHLNDTYGYSKTDRVIKSVSESLEESIRLSDSCFQFGGDEFPVLLVGAKREDLGVILERIIDKFETRLVELVAQGKIPEELVKESGFSVGLAKARVEEEFGERGVCYESPQKLFDRAAEFLHEAKGQRNRAVIEGDEKPIEIREDYQLNNSNSSKENQERYGW